MIITKTPLRVSFFGGGTDLKDYYNPHGGMVLSSTIDKYIYVIVNARTDNDIVLNYFKREQVTSIEQIQHRIIKEALRLTKLTHSIEITSISDIHEQGSGLGSSSAFTVGLLNALYAFKGEYKNPEELARLSCQIEIELLGEPIGKQDQYASAYGGFHLYHFHADESVEIEQMKLSANMMQSINSSTLLFDTGMSRKASSVLQDQKAKTNLNLENLHLLKELAKAGRDCLVNGDMKEIGRLLDENWARKKLLSNRIHNDEIDRIYSLGKQAGAYGGKLLGAGGGGYFLFLCQQEKKNHVRNALKAYKEMPFCFETGGSRIVFNDGKNVLS